MSAKTLHDITNLTEENRRLSNENLALQALCEKLRQYLIPNDNGYRRCSCCGGHWHDGDSEVHDKGCVAAPRVAPKPRASSSAQKPRSVPSRRKR